MDDNLNLRLLGMLLQTSYLMQTREKYRGQGRLLILLYQHGELTQRELIELTGRRSATLSEQLDGMEKAGLIYRCKNQHDKRNVDVALTEEGKKAAIQAIQNRQTYADDLFGTLPQKEKQKLAELLDILLHMWEVPINEEEYQVYNTEEEKHGCD
ncbi:MAG: MarR family transcriptional regulator [Lachnospiraceae bacterium]|nr:MarR family transcriptional regulator [Lachnospiraceae bacterium]MDY4969095.1 MarR family transcriptional regulator [Lachnospiraceae bacterium]